MAKSGWYKESARHSLAAKGVPTSRKSGWKLRKLSAYEVPVTNTADLTKEGMDRRQFIHEIGSKEGLSSYQRDQLVMFIERRFPDEQHPTYIATWAKRIRDGSVYSQGDEETRRIWLGIIADLATYNY